MSKGEIVVAVNLDMNIGKEILIDHDARLSSVAIETKASNLR
jgi:hypothetical protein